MRKGVLYDFDGFRMDTEQRCLLRGEDLVSLTPKAFETLLVLVKNQGKVISKDMLLDEVWKDTFVEESTLAQNISTLRKTFARYDTGKDYIITIPRRGYRFIADVTETAADEEVLLVEKRSVTHIVTEQEEVPDSEPKRSTRRWLLAIPGALAALIALLAGAVMFSHTSQYDTRFRDYRMSTLFSGKDISYAVVSPDGKYLAVLEKEKDGDAIRLRQIADGNSINLVQENGLLVSGVVFGPMGDSVYYSAYRNSDPDPKYGNLYRVPLLGGASQVIAHDVDGPVAFSPNRQEIVFIRDIPDKNESVLIKANADGSNERIIAKRSIRNAFQKSGLSWSPNGRLIAVTVRDRDDRKTPMKLVTVDAESGELKILPGNKWIWAGRAEWLSDGSGIAVVAYESKSPNLTDEVFFVSYPDGEVRSVTQGLSGITGVGVTDDAEMMVAGKLNRLTKRSFIELGEPEKNHLISKSVSEDSLFSLGARWDGNEKIVYSRTQNGSADIWSMSTDGKQQNQLTSGRAANYDPIVAPDGNSIYFRSNRNGFMTIWKMDPDGSNQTEIVNSLYASTPSLPDDGSVMYFSAVPEETRYAAIFRADSNGKNLKKITGFRSYAPSVSPDGKYILCFASKDGKPGVDLSVPLQLTLISAEDGNVIRQFEALKSRSLPLIVWKRDSNGFYFIRKDDGQFYLDERGLDGKTVKTLKRFDEERVFQMALSADGSRLFFETGEEVVSILRFDNA